MQMFHRHLKFCVSNLICSLKPPPPRPQILMKTFPIQPIPKLDAREAPSISPLTHHIQWFASSVFSTIFSSLSPTPLPQFASRFESWNEGFRVRSQTGTSAPPPACLCEWPWEVGLADPSQCGLFWHWVILCPLQSSPNLTHSHTSYADHQHLYLFNISKSVWASLVPQW